MPRPRPRPRPRLRRSILIAPLLAAAVAAAPDAGAQLGPPEDPGLEQTIERHQPIAAGPAELVDGHVDLGPRFVDGRLSLLVHDDSVEPSVWRPLDETVLRVGDDARRAVPDDPTYEFLGVEPGTEVHVLPQVQQDGVVWLGWNTQDPEVLERVDRGATLTLLGVDGPGDLVVYLQSGTLGDPEVLWRSTAGEQQSIWVELNTHTHANWVFTQPGAYVVQVAITAELVGGQPVHDVGTLRFAVGDAASADAARAARPTATLPPARDDGPVGPEPGKAADDDGGPGGVALVGVGAVVLLAGIGVTAARGAGARRRAREERADSGGGAAP